MHVAGSCCVLLHPSGDNYGCSRKWGLFQRSCLGQLVILLSYQFVLHSTFILPCIFDSRTMSFIALILHVSFSLYVHGERVSSFMSHGSVQGSACNKIPGRLVFLKSCWHVMDHGTSLKKGIEAQTEPSLCCSAEPLSAPCTGRWPGSRPLFPLSPSIFSRWR